MLLEGVETPSKEERQRRFDFLSKTVFLFEKMGKKR
jgi:hypothetical protein